MKVGDVVHIKQGWGRYGITEHIKEHLSFAEITRVEALISEWQAAHPLDEKQNTIVFKKGHSQDPLMGLIIKPSETFGLKWDSPWWLVMVLNIKEDKVVDVREIDLEAIK